jgi:hypothetical protein
MVARESPPEPPQPNGRIAKMSMLRLSQDTQ